jgi:hypothetical protein
MRLLTRVWLLSIVWFMIDITHIRLYPRSRGDLLVMAGESFPLARGAVRRAMQQRF